MVCKVRTDLLASADLLVSGSECKQSGWLSLLRHCPEQPLGGATAPFEENHRKAQTWFGFFSSNSENVSKPIRIYCLREKNVFHGVFHRVNNQICHPERMFEMTRFAVCPTLFGTVQVGSCGLFNGLSKAGQQTRTTPLSCDVFLLGRAAR